MSKLRSILLPVVFLLSLSNYLFSEETQPEASVSERKIKLTWEEVEGALGYKVVIKNSEDNEIIDQNVTSNNIVLEIPPGNYKIRIAPINKFSKLGNWSDWADLSVEKTDPKTKEKEKETHIAKTDLFDLGLKIGMGMSYFYILPEWNDYYKNSYNAYCIDIAYRFGKKTSPGFSKYIGVDFEANYIKFDGKNSLNRVESDITDIIAGANIFLSTNFNSRLNFAVRGGGGIAYTILEYQKYNASGNPIEKGTASTSDIYYKVGVSAECRFYSYLYFELFADYYNINYLINDFKGVKFSCLLGIRL